MGKFILINVSFWLGDLWFAKAPRFSFIMVSEYI